MIVVVIPIFLAHERIAKVMLDFFVKGNSESMEKLITRYAQITPVPRAVTVKILHGENLSMFPLALVSLILTSKIDSLSLTFFLGLFLMYLRLVGAVTPSYLPVISIQHVHGPENRNILIESYFNLGFGYEEILGFLVLCHGIRLSLRHLKRILKGLNLKRRCNRYDMEEVIFAIEYDLSRSGNCVGYQQMHQRLRNDYGIIVDRETVRLALKQLDPKSVNARLCKRLRSRQYVNQGPNYLWHLDGNDKLKPFGFCIHAAIDGYSRRILLLEVSNTNNNPKVVGQYYLSCVKELGGVPRCIWCHCGTENIYIAGVQRFFRDGGQDSFFGERSFMYGRSVSNQRIEAWWSYLRKTSTGWWMNFLEDMWDTGLYIDEDPVHIECLKFLCQLSGVNLTVLPEIGTCTG